jgi:hypothetical protein
MVVYYFSKEKEIGQVPPNFKPAVSKWVEKIKQEPILDLKDLGFLEQPKLFVDPYNIHGAIQLGGIWKGNAEHLKELFGEKDLEKVARILREISFTTEVRENGERLAKFPVVFTISPDGNINTLLVSGKNAENYLKKLEEKARLLEIASPITVIVSNELDDVNETYTALKVLKDNKKAVLYNSKFNTVSKTLTEEDIPHLEEYLKSIEGKTPKELPTKKRVLFSMHQKDFILFTLHTGG